MAGDPGDADDERSSLHGVPLRNWTRVKWQLTLAPSLDVQCTTPLLGRRIRAEAQNVDRVDNRAIVRTGGGGGRPGAALAFTRDGVTVGVLDRVRDEISERGAASIALTADVSWREQMTAALDDLVTRAGPLDNAEAVDELDADLVDIGDAQCRGQAMTERSMGMLRGQPATPDDIMGTAFYRASSDSEYLTGQVASIAGGMVLV
jgi:hypothetical protein